MDEIMIAQPYRVLVRVDDALRVVDINSSSFVRDTDSWVEIDSGWGDRYHHAQGNYFDKPLKDERGIYRYKLVDGKVVERRQDEMDADLDAMPRPGVSVSEVDAAMMELAALAAENAQRLDEQDAALVELAALIAGGVD